MKKLRLLSRYKAIMWRLLTYLLDKGWNDQDSFFCRWKWRYIVWRQHALYFLGICCHCGWRVRKSLEYCEKCFYQQTGLKLETKESDRYQPERLCRFLCWFLFYYLFFSILDM